METFIKILNQLASCDEEKIAEYEQRKKDGIIQGEFVVHFKGKKKDLKELFNAKYDFELSDACSDLMFTFTPNEVPIISNIGFSDFDYDCTFTRYATGLALDAGFLMLEKLTPEEQERVEIV